MNIEAENKILVLGIGNILMSDEGVGVRVIEKLEKEYAFPPNVTLLDGGTAGYALLDIMKEYDRVIIIDAVKGGKTPGSLYRLTADDIITRAELKLSGHQIDLAEVIALAKRLGDLPDLLLLGIEPGLLDYSSDLSTEVNGTLNKLTGLVADELKL